MTEPHTDRTFHGTVVPEGQQDILTATLAVDNAGLTATTEDGQAHHIPFHDLRFDLGGENNTYLYCRTRGAGGPSIASNAEGLLDALRQMGGDTLSESLDDIDGKIVRTGRFRKAYWGCLGGSVASVVLVIVLGLALTPFILSLMLDAVPLEVDKMLGEAAYEEMSRSQTTVTDERIVSVVEEMVERISEEASIKDFEFRVDVVQNDEVNAFALPGGQMVVYTGLLERAASPDQVAGVIGHEIAHVTLRHSMKQTAAKAGMGIVVFLVLGDISGWLVLAGEAAAIVASNSYSRGQESDADAEGARMLAAAGLDPEGLIGFFDMLKVEPGTELPEGLGWLSTHPEHQARIDHINEILPELPKARARPLEADWDAMKEALDGL